MFEFIKTVHEALGIESTAGFVAVFALLGALTLGGGAYLVDRTYKNALAVSAPSDNQQLARALRATGAVSGARVLVVYVALRHEDLARLIGRAFDEAAAASVVVRQDTVVPSWVKGLSLWADPRNQKPVRDAFEDAGIAVHFVSWQATFQHNNSTLVWPRHFDESADQPVFEIVVLINTD